MLCILRHRGVQLILAYNWARPASLVAGNGRGIFIYFFCSFTFCRTICSKGVGGAKVLCILRHRGVQLILAYNWARPASLVAGNGRGIFFYFFCSFTFIPVPLSSLSSLSLSFISSTISSVSSLPFSGKRHRMTHRGSRIVKPQNKQSIFVRFCTIKLDGYHAHIW